MATKQERIEKNLNYVREQLSRFMFKNYGIKYEYKLFANKDLKKIRRFSKMTFPENKRKKEVVEIDIEYETVFKGNRQALLDIAFRCAIRLALWYRGLPYKEGHPLVNQELAKYNLKNYNGLAEMGLDLHTYSCSQCTRVWATKQRKLPASKDPVEKGLKTGCCHALFKYDGLIFYDNEQLVNIFKQVNKNEMKHGIRKNITEEDKKNPFDFW